MGARCREVGTAIGIYSPRCAFIRGLRWLGDEARGGRVIPLRPLLRLVLRAGLRIEGERGRC
eukprot:1196146-Prorocentrum_minimum.AAC.11